MLGRWWYYCQLSTRDLVRLWPSTQHHIIIVAGICLPILMLLGLKRGHVETLRQDLITSPTGRQVTFWSAQKGELMTRDSINSLGESLPSVDLIIPETQRIVSIKREDGAEDEFIQSVTVYPTRPNDPLICQRGLPTPKSGSHEILISEAVAKALRCRVNDRVIVTITRGRGQFAEAEQVNCEVIGILKSDEHAAMIAYVDLDLLDQLDAYSRGFRVPDLGWASAKSSPPDSYSSYLIFCEKSGDLTDRDREYLRDRGFQLEPIVELLPSALTSLLVPDVAEKVIVYRAATSRSTIDPKSRLRIAPSELSQATEADDVVLAWNPPCRAEVDGNWEMVGLSMSRRTWLREYFKDPTLPFDYDANAMQCRPHGFSYENDHVAWPLSSGVTIPITIDLKHSAEANHVDGPPPPEATTPTEAEAGVVSKTGADRVLVVPADMLAWVDAYAAGIVEYDEAIHMFVSKPESPVYDRARLYARTIDDVPFVVSELAKKYFAVMSENGRISEIQRQDQSLQLLVWIVGLGVFFFGVLTVFSVLMDSTDRKRGAIGVLRVMGMSRSGIFASVLLRAIAIGGGAAILSLALGAGLSAFLCWSPAKIDWLQWKPIVSIQLAPIDIFLVAVGAMLCCGLGALLPAWKASQLDPFDAIVEGRFR